MDSNVIGSRCRRFRVDRCLKDIEGVEVIGVMVLALAFVTASTAFRRWSLNERAMRLEQPLPASYLPQITAIGVALIGVAAVILLVIDTQ